MGTTDIDTDIQYIKNKACNKPICNSKTYFAKLRVIQSHLLKKSLVKILDSMQSIEWFSYTQLQIFPII